MQDLHYVSRQAVSRLEARTKNIFTKQNSRTMLAPKSLSHQNSDNVMTSLMIENKRIKDKSHLLMNSIRDKMSRRSLLMNLKFK